MIKAAIAMSTKSRKIHRWGKGFSADAGAGDGTALANSVGSIASFLSVLFGGIRRVHDHEDENENTWCRARKDSGAYNLGQNTGGTAEA